MKTGASGEAGGESSFAAAVEPFMDVHRDWGRRAELRRRGDDGNNKLCCSLMRLML